MLIFLLFGVLCILGEAEGQNCMFPCSWRNRDFEMSTGSTFSPETWKISETTLIIQDEFSTRDLECFKIVGRFLILRIPNTRSYRCYVIEIHNADSFTALTNFGYFGPFTNECTVCDKPNTQVLFASAVDTVAQNQTGAECNIPVGCISASFAVNPIICKNNGIIEGECSETTIPPTTPPTTTPTIPPPPATPPTTLPPPPKPCKHRHP